MSGRRANVISLAERIVEKVQNFLSTREMHEETFRWTDLVEDVAEALSDDFDERLASAPAPLAWSSVRPTKPGFYLRRHGPRRQPWLYIHSGLGGCLWWYGEEFAGPFPEPMEPPSC